MLGGLKTLQLAQANTSANEHTPPNHPPTTPFPPYTLSNGAAEWQANVALFRSLTFGRRHAGSHTPHSRPYTTHTAQRPRSIRLYWRQASA